MKHKNYHCIWECFSNENKRKVQQVRYDVYVCVLTTKEAGEGMAAAALLDLQCTLLLMVKERYRSSPGLPSSQSRSVLVTTRIPLMLSSSSCLFPKNFKSSVRQYPDHDSGNRMSELWSVNPILELRSILVISEFLLYSGYVFYANATRTLNNTCTMLMYPYTTLTININNQLDSIKNILALNRKLFEIVIK